MKRRKSSPRLRFFPPWFVPMDVLRQLEKLLPVYYHQRFRLYFDKHGCVHCKRKNILYGCNGLCVSCLPLITARLRQIDKDMKWKYGKQQSGSADRFLQRRECAQQLLADLRADDLTKKAGRNQNQLNGFQ